MESKPQEKQRPRDIGKVYLALMVAALVVSAGAVAYVLYSNSKGTNLRTFETVAMGDEVYLDYIGRLPDGRVFDTSILEVARDPVLYPKSLTFSSRQDDEYSPLRMTAGEYGPGGTIKGFALGVIGMRTGETRIIEVSPDEGYPVNPDMLVEIDIDQEVPATETMEASEFRTLFATDPVLMATVPHYFWGWDVIVVEVTGGTVTLRHEPVVGQVVQPFGNPDDVYDPAGWDCVVQSYDRLADEGVGKIVVQHLVSQEDVYYVKGVYQDGLTFVLWDYDASSMEFVIHKSNPNIGYNGEISGRTLYFEVTVVAF